MAKTYVVADLHGRFDLLEAALARIEEHSPGKVVFTGDFIDGGPQSRGVVARQIAGPGDGWEWVFVRGNHEDMLLDCYAGKNLSWWLKHGGRETIDSYSGEIDPAHIEWMRSLPRLYSDRHRVYVHAGVDECYDLDQQPVGLTHWYRYAKGANDGYRGMHVVHGTRHAAMVRNYFRTAQTLIPTLCPPDDWWSVCSMTRTPADQSRLSKSPCKAIEAHRGAGLVVCIAMRVGLQLRPALAAKRVPGKPPRSTTNLHALRAPRRAIVTTRSTPRPSTSAR